MEENKIVIYQTEDGKTQIDVRLENETVWLSANQMAKLFDRDAKTVRKHINNVFEEEEVPQDNNTHFLRVDGVKQPVAYYSLDVIISVGYRVKSKRGTDFRIWARKVLKQYLIKGFAVNDRIRQEQTGELRQLVQVVGRAITNQEVPDTIESQDLLNVVVDYSYALDTLDNYDYERLTIDDTTQEEPFHATYENAMQEIARLRDKFGGSALFGNEKDDSF
ncbi:MAG: virulence RhuM family protein, partial [Bacteroidaceae bacterium]|nr:virulence RhuM family protein [Bacteroidaceae bacterium]